MLDAPRELLARAFPPLYPPPASEPAAAGTHAECCGSRSASPPPAAAARTRDRSLPPAPPPSPAASGRAVAGAGTSAFACPAPADRSLTPRTAALPGPGGLDRSRRRRAATARCAGCRTCPPYLLAGAPIGRSGAACPPMPPGIACAANSACAANAAARQRHRPTPDAADAADAVDAANPRSVEVVAVVDVDVAAAPAGIDSRHRPTWQPPTSCPRRTK